MKKSIIIMSLLLFPALIVMRYVSGADGQSFFRKNILEPIPESVTNFKYQKDTSAAQEAVIFSFNAQKPDVKLIITKRNLDKFLEYEQLPDIVKYVIKDRFKDVPWWHSEELESMEIFGLSWVDDEPHVLVIFVSKQDIIYGIRI